MDSVRWCGRLAALVTIGLVAVMPAAQAEIVKPATPVHTAATRHRHAAHRHHHRARTASLGAGRIPSHPAVPAPSAPERTRHRATLPSLAHGPRHVTGPKTGSSRAAVAAPTGSLVTVMVHPLEPRQNASPDTREHPVTGGRGPPRGSPTTPSADPPSSASARAPRSAPSCASAASLDPPCRAVGVADHTRGRLTGAHPDRASVSPDLLVFPFSRFSPRWPLGRLHAVRPEGATACFSMPSIGGTPCPA